MRSDYPPCPAASAAAESDRSIRAQPVIDRRGRTEGEADGDQPAQPRHPFPSRRCPPPGGGASVGANQSTAAVFCLDSSSFVLFVLFVVRVGLLPSPPRRAHAAPLAFRPP